MVARTLSALDKEITNCRKCPRLVQWREEVAVTKRRAYIGEKYWGKAITSFGAEDAHLLIVGLAPGAHGANRTGRVFTGDSSGDWLFASLHRLGIAKIGTSTSRDDGQQLKKTRISIAVRCVPPGNKPTTEERDMCSPYFLRELQLLQPTVRAFVPLGAFAWGVLIASLKELGHPVPTGKFGHGAKLKYSFQGIDYLIIGSYHVSQQNTFTGKLTELMLDKVMKEAAVFAGVIKGKK